MTKTEWTAEEVHAMAEKLSADVPRFNTEDERLCAVAMLTAFAERIAADEAAVPDGYDVGWKIRGVGAYNRAKSKGFKHPECVEAAIKTAQPAQLDCPKCHGTGEVSDSDGLYVGQCTACRAIKQPAQEQPGWKVPETVFSEEMIREEIDYTKRFTGQKMLADFAKIVAASPAPPKEK